MNNPLQVEKVLYEFSVEQNHDAETLERYVTKYPELAEDLVDLAFELRLANAEKQTLGEVQPPPDPGAGQAWQQFVASGSRSASKGTLLSRFRGPAFVELAERLRLPRSILIAFRDRLVEPSSIPERILNRFAEATESTVQTIRDYLSHPPLIIRTAQFKADQKPTEQGRITFQQLVESTQMSDAERKALLEECADGLDRG